jgi:hypothetical protein
MKLQNAVGDLQKGEKCISPAFFSPWLLLRQAFLRYINMDYLFFSAMRH